MFVAGAKTQDDKTVTAGGRVLGVTALGKDLKQAVDKAYSQVNYVTFDNAYYRKDIGKRALEVK